MSSFSARFCRWGLLGALAVALAELDGKLDTYANAIVANNPQVLFARCEERGYGLLDITPRAVTTELRAVANPMRADTTVYTLARFAVQNGVPGPVRI